MQKFIQAIGTVLSGVLAVVFVLVVVVFCLPLIPWQAWKNYRLLNQFWMAQLRFRGQWVTAQKLKRAAKISDSDIRMLLSHNRVLDEYTVRRREYAVCERISQITGRKIPRLNRLPSMSTVAFYEFRYQPIGRLQQPSWGKAYQLAIPTARV